MGHVSSLLNKLFNVVYKACTRAACMLYNILFSLLPIGVNKEYLC